MKITVRLGEPFWRTVGQRNVELTLGQGATVADALDALKQAHPTLADELSSGEGEATLFLEDEVAQPELPLRDGSKLYLVWPISGGG